jgi:hypothetical protein
MKQKLIEELATHCDFYVGNEWYMESPEEKQRIWTEKFAELIVQECTNIVNKRKDAAIEASWCVDEAMSNAVWDIEAHFYGAEE